MAKFKLDTDAIDTAVTNINSVSKEISNLQSEVSGYTVPSDPEFDFAGAKAKLAESLDSCESVLKNTAKALQNVAETHTNLQEKTFSFDNQEDYSKKTAGSSKKGKQGKQSGEVDDNGAVYGGTTAAASAVATAVNNAASQAADAVYQYNQSSSGTSPSGGSSSYSGSSSHSSSSSHSGTKSNEKSTKTESKVEEKDEQIGLDEEYTGLENSYKNNPEANNEIENTTGTTENEPVETSTKVETTPTSTVITNSFTNVDYAYIKEDNLKEESTVILSNASFDPNSGYSMIGDKYLITCDSSLGKVGDVIKFTNKDGTTLECIVGINTYSPNYQKSVNFLVDRQTWSTKTPLSITENLLTNNEKIENIGAYDIKSYISEEAK